MSTDFYAFAEKLHGELAATNGTISAVFGMDRRINTKDATLTILKEQLKNPTQLPQIDYVSRFADSINTDDSRAKKLPSDTLRWLARNIHWAFALSREHNYQTAIIALLASAYLFVRRNNSIATYPIFTGVGSIGQGILVCRSHAKGANAIAVNKTVKSITGLHLLLLKMLAKYARENKDVNEITQIIDDMFTNNTSLKAEMVREEGIIATECLITEYNIDMKLVEIFNRSWADASPNKQDTVRDYENQIKNVLVLSLEIE